MPVPPLGPLDGGFSNSAPGVNEIPKGRASISSETSPAPQTAELLFPGLTSRTKANRRSVEIDRERWNEAFTCKQWTVATKPLAAADEDTGSEVAEYRLVNLKNGLPQYYEVVSGQYGEPIMRPEPERALGLPKGIEYVHCSTGEPVTLKDKISGIILKDAADSTVDRFSLTNAAQKGIDLKLSDDGCLMVDGKKYYLRSLLSKDKKRICNYDGFFSEIKPENGTVKFWEMEDLPL